MAKTKPLSERERRFVEAFMGPAAGNATVAATLAGYSAKSAARIGYRLSKKVHVQTAIRERQKADPAIADRRQLQQLWTRIATGQGKFSKAALKDRLKASELLGKSQAAFIDKHEHTGPNGQPIETRVIFGGRYKQAQEPQA